MNPTATAVLRQVEPEAERESLGRVFGIDCFAGDLDAAADAVVRRAASRKGGRMVLANVHVLTTALQHDELRATLESAWKVFPDGAPVAWLERQRGAAAARRIAGPDLMPCVLDRGRSYELRHALVGSTQDVVDRLVFGFGRRFPGVRIVQAISPAPGDENSSEVLDSLAASQPHIVWVALGAPKQELWTQRHADYLASSLLAPVGAAFDFNAGTKPRAPEWMQRHSLEWLHRLGTEPRRLGWRYVSTNSAFFIQALRELRQPTGDNRGEPKAT